MVIKKSIFILGVIFSVLANGQTNNSIVRFHYLGHSSFMISFGKNVTVLTDYGKPDAFAAYGWSSPISSNGDAIPTIATYSHSHDDHYDSTRVPKEAKYILRDSCKLKSKNLSIETFRTSEKDIKTKDNISFLFRYQDITVLHFGDCQANIFMIDSTPDREYIEKVVPKNCDVVLLPIESTKKFIPQVEKFIRLIHPKVVIPMHYWSTEYKQQFFDYLINSNSGSLYKIIKISEGDYLYCKNEETDSISIIDISPGKINL